MMVCRIMAWPVAIVVAAATSRYQNGPRIKSRAINSLALSIVMLHIYSELSLVWIQNSQIAAKMNLRLWTADVVWFSMPAIYLILLSIIRWGLWRRRDKLQRMS